MTPATPRPEFDVEAAKRDLALHDSEDQYDEDAANEAALRCPMHLRAALTEIDRLRAENEKLRAGCESLIPLVMVLQVFQTITGNGDAKATRSVINKVTAMLDQKPALHACDCMCSDGAGEECCTCKEPPDA